jgi:NAD(P)H-hydrate epimerase
MPGLVGLHPHVGRQPILRWFACAYLHYISTGNSFHQEYIPDSKSTEDGMLSNHESIPALTTAQMIEVDRAMIEDYDIELIQMMENAGRHLAELARRWLGGTVKDRSVVVLCGNGNNGGGGMTAARRLHNWGAKVVVALTKSVDELRGVPAHQLDILQRMDIPILERASLHFDDAHYSPDALRERKPSTVDLILDAIIGYSLSGSPRGMAADLIRWANGQNVPILSLDTPSGLDVTSGTAYEPTIRATATLTLALPKIGLLNPQSATYVGDLYLADISVPPELYARMGIIVPPLFADSDLIKVTR